MVRISDLIRGNVPQTVSREDSDTEGIKYNLGIVLNSKEKDKPTDIVENRPAGTEAPPTETVDACQAAVSLYREAQHYLIQTREVLLSGMPIRIDPSIAVIARMIADKPLVEKMYALTSSQESEDDDPDVSSSVNSMIYCLKVSRRMGYSTAEIEEICLAALHHDIGMFLLPRSILLKESRLTEIECAELKKHTETGRDIMKPFDATYPTLSRAIYEHHERENGLGYPLGLKGGEICEYAKLIGLCDSYEAMTHTRSYRKAVDQHRSIVNLTESRAELFPPYIIKAFLDEITVYPIGSYVRLNNGALGVVIETNRSSPFKPIIRIIVDGQGNRVLGEKHIDLSKQTILNIRESVSRCEVTP